jgi:hypothetical protein
VFSPRNEFRDKPTLINIAQPERDQAAAVKKSGEDVCRTPEFFLYYIYRQTHTLNPQNALHHFVHCVFNILGAHIENRHCMQITTVCLVRCT